LSFCVCSNARATAAAAAAKILTVGCGAARGRTLLRLCYLPLGLAGRAADRKARAFRRTSRPLPRQLPSSIIAFADADAPVAQIEHRRPVAGFENSATRRFAECIDRAPLPEGQDAVGVPVSLALRAVVRTLATPPRDFGWRDRLFLLVVLAGDALRRSAF